MADNNNQQYMWRQRKKRNARLTIWIILVILLAAAGTFAWRGIRESDPQRIAEKYYMAAIGVEGYTVKAGDRSLNEQNQFVQDYTFTYTADGVQENKKISLTQQKEKKYGLFEQWEPQMGAAKTVDLDLIAPAGSQVLIDGCAPDASSVKADDTLSPGAVCYQLAGVDPEAKLQVNGLPFSSYEGTLDTNGSVLDVRNMLSVSDNAKVQMEEIGKRMINELYTAVLTGGDASSLGNDFAKVANKENLFRAVSDNLHKDGELLADSVSFQGFEAAFGDVYYPGKSEESFVGIEMTLSYTCSFEAAQAADGEEETEETEGAEQETGKHEATEEKREAKFSFRYQDGACVVASAEIPGVIS